MPAPPLLPVQDENERSLAVLYKPGPSLSEFHLSPVKIRGLVGGRGSGKTTTVAVEVVGHTIHNAGSKVYVLRKTQESNKDTTLDSFEQVFWMLGGLYQDTGQSLFKKMDGGKTFRLPSRKAIELFNQFMSSGKPTKAQILNWLDTVGNRFCSWLQFAGVPTSAMRGSRFRGYECSMLIFVEADQLEREDLDLGVACLRWKGVDPEVCDSKGFIRDTCVILDTNPPSPQHWIAKFEKEALKDKDTSIRFWHIPTEENRHNLPDGYIEQLTKQYRGNPAMYDRMIMGQYAEAFDGQRVLYAFNMDHVRERLPWPKGAYLIRSWDFGTKHATIFSAYWVLWDEVEEANGVKRQVGTEYWWDLHEYYSEQSDTERQCRNVLDITQSIFPFWNDRDLCSGVRDYCDVAGNQNNATGSSVKVLRSHQVYPAFKKMGLQESIAIYNRLLQKTDAVGHPVYWIDKISCPRLFAGSFGGYRYPMVGEVGYGSDEPMKDGYFDHLCLARGTRVLTDRGYVRIESVSQGDFAMTRRGFRLVTAAWRTSDSTETHRYVFSNGTEVWATDDHPVWVKGRGWTPFAKLNSGDIVSTTSRGSAATAGPSISRAGMQHLERAAVRFVGRSSVVRSSPVYNLTVEGQHEFYAEGVLVSNCDASRYGKVNCMRLLVEEYERTKHVVGVLAQKKDLNRKRRWW